MEFRHSAEIWSDFPELVPGVLFVEGISADASVSDRVAGFAAVARSRLANGTEGEFPEVQAWRRAFARMGLKPTQYRCASEALLRRFRQEGALPRIHPLIDLCNAVSLAFAIPVAAFDASKIADKLEVRRAAGEEVYLTFSGTTEAPERGEVIFADSIGRAHARRWTNRQSGYSAVRRETRGVLIVAEAMHASAREDASQLLATLADGILGVWRAAPKSAMLSASSPRFAF